MIKQKNVKMATDSSLSGMRPSLISASEENTETNNSQL
jgi:hypothetical protein